MFHLGLQRVSVKMFQCSKKNTYMLKTLSGYAKSLALHRAFCETSKPLTFQHDFSYGALITKSSCRCFATEIPKLPKQKSRGKIIGPITWRNLLITLGFGGILMVGMLYVKKDKQRMIDMQQKREMGKAAIGGKFDLIDHNGKPCSSDDFLGNWVLLYFGFTHCPDVCPEEIEKMMEIIEITEKSPKLPKVFPVMITVDAERDSVDVIAKYVKEFSPKLIGLTGSKEQVHRATRAYRVYYSEGPRDEDDDYIVDHTIIIYLLNPDGEFVDYYGQTKSADQIAAALAIQMLRYQNEHKKSWFG